MGTAFLLLSSQTQMSYTRQIRKEKAASAGDPSLHTCAPLFADDDGIIKSYIPLFYYKGRECERGGSSDGGGTNFTASDEFLELETHCV